MINVVKEKQNKSRDPSKFGACVVNNSPVHVIKHKKRCESQVHVQSIAG